MKEEGKELKGGEGSECREERGGEEETDFTLETSRSHYHYAERRSKRRQLVSFKSVVSCV